jgi:hypothetical protein
MTAPIPARKVRPQLPLAAYRYLLAGQKSAWFFLEIGSDPEAQKLFWEQHANAVVLHHVKRHPGTRPKMWWKFSSPEPRRRVGGLGSPLSECGGAHAPNFEYGVPSAWRTARDFELGFARSGTPLSDDDPPLFESEAAYLLRHHLLLPDERRRLSRASYQPDVLVLRDGHYQLLRQDRFQRQRAIEFERIGPLRALLNVGTDR